MKDTSIDGAIRKALASQKDQTAGQCPDENILAAYLEMSLEEAERQCVENHASSCAACRQTLGLALRLSESEAGLCVGPNEVPSSKKTLFRISLPVSMVAMIALTLLAGALFYRILRESARLPAVPQTAQLQTPAKAEGISALKTSEADLLKQKAAPREQHIATPVGEARKRVPETAQPTGFPSQATKDAELSLTQAADRISPPAGVKTDISAEGRIPELAASPPPAPAPAVPAVAQLARRTGDVALESKTVSAPEEYKRVGAVAGSEGGFSKANLGANAPVAAMGLRQLGNLSPEITPLEALMDLARLVSSEPGKLVGKKLGGRTFYFNSGYWIDSQCIKQISADRAVVENGSAEDAQNLRSIPELEKIRPAIVYWNGKNLVLR